jgi:hypothetical protein
MQRNPRRIRSGDVATAARASSRGRIGVVARRGDAPWTLVGMLVAVALGVMVFALARQTGPIQLGKDLWLRDVYVLLDRTRSMDSLEFQAAKDFIRKQILDSIGPGDRVFCYTVGTGFREQRNLCAANVTWVAARESLLTSTPRPDAMRDSVARALWDEAEVAQALWRKPLDTLRQEDCGRSDYYGAIEYVAQRVGAQALGSATEHWLVIIGDLQPNPARPPVGIVDTTAFKEIRVRLVYSYRSATPDHAGCPAAMAERARSSDELLRSWKEYFVNRGGADLQWTVISDVGGPISANSVYRPLQHPPR